MVAIRADTGTVAAVLAAAIYGFLSLAGTSSAAEPVRIGTSKTGMLIWLADAQGYLDGLNIEIEEVGSGVVATNRVTEGSLHFGTSSEFAFASKFLTDSSICLYATVSASRTTRLISRSDKIGSAPSDLAGAKIAVTANGIGQFFLSQYLILSNVDITEVTLVDARPEEIVQLISDGDVDAAMTWEPHVTKIRTQLGDVAVDYPDQADQYFYFVLHGRCDISAETTETLAGFLEGLLKAEEFARENPEQAKDALADRLALDREALDAIWPQHSLALVIPQDLISAIEIEAEWRIENGLAEGPAPNVLNSLKPGPLESVAPQAVRLIY